MGRTGKVHSTELDRLRDEYLDMRAEVKRIEREVEAEIRAKIEEEIEYRTRNVKRAFAVRFVEVRDSGATRKELVRVIGDGTAEVMRELIELGGGSVRKPTTSNEQQMKRAEEIGVTETAPGRYLYRTPTGEEIPVYLIWSNGNQVLWADGDDLYRLQDALGSPAAMREKAEEIVSVFGYKGS